MNVFLILVLIWVSLILPVILYTLIHTSESVALFSNRMLGRETIIIEGIGGAIDGAFWKSHVVTTPITGKRIAYRYPVHFIGEVTLNDDGTGYYCGPIRWKKL